MHGRRPCISVKLHRRMQDSSDLKISDRQRGAHPLPLLAIEIEATRRLAAAPPPPDLEASSARVDDPPVGSRESGGPSALGPSTQRELGGSEAGRAPIPEVWPIRADGCGDTPSATVGSLPRTPRRENTWLDPLLGCTHHPHLRPACLACTVASVLTSVIAPLLVRHLCCSSAPATPLSPLPQHHDGLCVLLCGRHPPDAICVGRPRRGGCAGVGRPRGPLVHGPVQGHAVYGGTPGARRDACRWYVLWVGTCGGGVGSRLRVSGGCGKQVVVWMLCPPGWVFLCVPDVR